MHKAHFALDELLFSPRHRQLPSSMPGNPYDGHTLAT